MKKVIFLGLDVDDQAFHGASLLGQGGQFNEFKCRPTLKGLSRKLEGLQARYPGGKIEICYEASYVGFHLKRELNRLGYPCEVVSPSHTPRIGGNAVKTDRIDAKKLVRFYANGQLTVVKSPTEEQERDRDLLRSRQRILHQLSEIRCHIQALLRRQGMHYKAETGNKSHWTKQHLCWLERKTEEASGSLAINLGLLLQQMKWLKYTLEQYNGAIEELAQEKRYQKPVKALSCYKGIGTVFAMVMLTEIGDIARFAHPRQLVSYIGLDIREYSSGGRHHRLGITKHGNRYLRTAFVEANQRGWMRAVVGEDLKKRREGTPPKLVHIADRCLKRLTKKGRRLLMAGKHRNKVKVACAREMVGFVWESLRAVSPREVAA